MLRCTVEGCDKKSRALELCMMHYMRMRKHGNFNSLRPYKYQGYYEIICAYPDCEIRLNRYFKNRKTGLCRKHYLLSKRNK